MDGSAALDFGEFAEVHYAAFAVIADSHGAPWLLFEGNIDGPIAGFLARLVAEQASELDAIYQHCVGYPPTGARSSERSADYLKDHDIGPGTFFVAFPGATVDRIQAQVDQRDRIQALLDAELGLRNLGPAAIRGAIASAPSTGSPAVYVQPILVRHGRVLALAVAVAVVAAVVGALATIFDAVGASRLGGFGLCLAVLAAGAGLAYLWLRRRERADDRADAHRADSWEAAYNAWAATNLAQVREGEDLHPQNHMVSVTRIKGGRFRLAVLRVVLGLIGLVARFLSNRGSLGGISSIHFARSVIGPDRQTLIFLSNFDGSWESYLGDFIDLAAKGLTAVWSNTTNPVGFPSTHRLAGAGARDEARFKAYARSSMVPTLLWYAAYPDLTVANIKNNRAIAAGLRGTLNEREVRAWLRHL